MSRKNPYDGQNIQPEVQEGEKQKKKFFTRKKILGLVVLMGFGLAFCSNQCSNEDELVKTVDEVDPNEDDHTMDGVVELVKCTCGRVDCKCMLVEAGTECNCPPLVNEEEEIKEEPVVEEVVVAPKKKIVSKPSLTPAPIPKDEEVMQPPFTDDTVMPPGGPVEVEPVLPVLPVEKPEEEDKSEEDNKEDQKDDNKKPDGSHGGSSDGNHGGSSGGNHGGSGDKDPDKPDEPKPDEPKPDEPKPDEPKPDEPKPDDSEKPGQVITPTEPSGSDDREHDKDSDNQENTGHRPPKDLDNTGGSNDNSASSGDNSDSKTESSSTPSEAGNTETKSSDSESKSVSNEPSSTPSSEASHTYAVAGMRSDMITTLSMVRGELVATVSAPQSSKTFVLK